MDARLIWVALGVIVVVVVGATIVLNSDDTGNEHRSGTYGMDLTVNTENVTNVDSYFRIVVLGDNGRITYAEKGVYIDAHDKASVRIPIDWNDNYGFYAQVKVTREGGAFAKQGLMLHSGEDQEITVIPKG